VERRRSYIIAPRLSAFSAQLGSTPEKIRGGTELTPNPKPAIRKRKKRPESDRYLARLPDDGMWARCLDRFSLTYDDHRRRGILLNSLIRCCAFSDGHFIGPQRLEIHFVLNQVG